jgi:hypothetical protein
MHRFHVYKHTGDPESGLLEDPLLRSEEGFATFEEASERTQGLLPDHHLVMLRGRYSGLIVSIRRAGREAWPAPSANASVPASQLRERGGDER